MNIKRIMSALLVVVVLSASALAASEPRILQQRFDQSTNNLTLYVRNTGGAAVTQVTVGGVSVDDAKIAPDASETSLVTWLLIDNSSDVPQEMRQKVSDLLTTLLGEKGRGETYNFCTFSDHLSVKLRNSSSFAELKQQIDGLEYYEQETYLMGAVDEVLSEEASRTGNEFVRIVILSTGGDNVPSGKTIENLRGRLTSSRFTVSNIPIYTIGCDTGENRELLSQMYALSTETYARSWDMNAVGASDIANIMHWEEIPVRVSLTVPGNLSGGSAQEVQVTFADGSSAWSSIDILGSGGENGGGENGGGGGGGQTGLPIWVIILIVVLVLGLAGAGVAIFLMRNRDKDKIVSVDPVPLSGGRSSHTDILGGGGGGGDGATDILGGGDDYDDATTPIFNDDNDGTSRVLYLTDQDHPERQFNASLREPVTIGRGANNRIVLDYDKSISGSHCEIFTDGYSFRIRDLNSSNGTYIGPDRVVNVMEISSGATIRLGRLSFRVDIR